MNRRWLVDLNVVLDVLLDRPGHAATAAALWACAERREMELLVAAHAVTTLHYIAQRGRGRQFADGCVVDVLSVFGVAAVDEPVLRRAVALGWSDFEDAIVCTAAEAAGCSAILTRDPRGFADSGLPVHEPGAAVAMESLKQ